MNTKPDHAQTHPFPQHLEAVLWRVIEHRRYEEYLDYQKNPTPDHIYRAKCQLLQWLTSIDEG